jgi:hypothetical protein
MPFRAFLVSTLLALAPCLHAQTAADTDDIRAAVLGYAEGWYAAHAGRMPRALHFVTADERPPSCGGCPRGRRES